MSNDGNVHIGNSGEYFVAAELERRGMICAVPMSNVEKIDLLAINPDTLEQYAIQVKSTSKKSKTWLLNKKNETFYGDNFFYIFVSLNQLETPEYHIVPSEIVANTIKRDHEEWLANPGRKGQKHNDTNNRKFSDKGDKYLNQWSYITTSTSH